MLKEKTDWRIIITAIISIVVILCWALYLGHNGTLLAIGIGIIAAIAGVVTPSPIKIKK